ncbi:hypothetical protein AVEN_168360-1 [Araneus ventricosus]|uniref:Uncharacterized protein n=1 Tax=Araneus ventricosus TaxID=182803 RepID=A0A4Y2QQA3_ARAVE|nr:hypothetical protein AVEN_168360-1 [Araneus ventricosus]
MGPSGEISASGWMAPGSNQIPQNIRRECGPVARQIIRSGPNVLPLVWCGSLERVWQLRCRPFHPILVQNYEVRPQIAPVLLQNGMLKLN